MSVFKTAADRMNERRTPNVLILAESGMGKTYQVQYFPPAETAFINIEGGDISIDYSTWDCKHVIDVIEISRSMSTPENQVHPFELVMGILCVASGTSHPEYGDEYNDVNYAAYCQGLGGADIFSGTRYFAVDSLTQLDQLCSNYILAKRKAEVTAKGGSVDGWAVSKLHRSLMSNLVKVAQQIKDKSLIMFAILDKKKDDNGFAYYKPQFTPSVYEEVKGIMDMIGSIVKLPNPNNGNIHEQVLITHPENTYGLPGKKRGNHIPDMVGIMNAPGLYGVIKKVEESLSTPPNPMGEYKE